MITIPNRTKSRKNGCKDMKARQIGYAIRQILIGQNMNLKRILKSSIGEYFEYAPEDRMKNLIENSIDRRSAKAPKM